jgi:hypothetical protein
MHIHPSGIPNESGVGHDEEVDFQNQRALEIGSARDGVLISKREKMNRELRCRLLTGGDICLLSIYSRALLESLRL